MLGEHGMTARRVPARVAKVRSVNSGRSKSQWENVHEARHRREPPVERSIASIGYFPAPYPEEIIYSVLARYSRYVGHPKPDRLNTLLFGRAYYRCNIEFSSRLGLLASKLPNPDALTADTMLFGHTMFPYYASFMKPARRAAAIAARISPEGSTTPLIVNRWKWLQVDKTLRFCPKCVVRMHADQGELYWRRDHQIPTVLLCPDHDEVLLRADMSAAGVGGWCAATSATCPDSAEPLVDALTEADRRTLLEIAKRSLALLRDNQSVICRTTDRVGYRELLVAKGLGRGSTFGGPSEIHKALLRRFGHLRRFWPEIFDATEVKGSGAIHRIGGTGGEVTHPIMHILIAMMLEMRPDVRPAFGHGPWACPNPIVQHSNDMPVTEIARRRVAGGKVICQFTCGCGYVHMRSELEDGRQTKPVFRSFGPSLGPFLARAEAEGWSPQRAADLVGMNILTLRSAAAAMNLECPWLWQRGRGRWVRRVAKAKASSASLDDQEEG